MYKILYTPLLKDILFVSSFWQLLLKFLQLLMCRFLCEHEFSNQLSKILRNVVPGLCDWTMFSFVRN